jgi:3-oxoacyl-[acyl-carrier-protein] synthase III
MRLKVTNVYLSGLGVFQPPVADAGQAARRGEYSPAAYLENRLTGACIAGDISPPEMAVRAARQALSRAAADPARLDMVLHATAFLQGPEMWLPGPYIQREIVGTSAPAFEIRLGCNGVFAGLELAAGRMAAATADRTVLLTTAENLGSPLIDRWNSAPGFILGDAGSALLLDRGDGFARLRAVGSVAVPEVEPMYRGGEPLYPPPVWDGRILDLRDRVQYFRDNVMSLTDAAELRTRARLGLIERTLDEADRKLVDMTRVICGNAAAYLVEHDLLEPLGIAMERTTWQFGRGIGHTCASDQLLSVNHLLVTGQLAAGDHLLLVGGAPATMSCAVLEILDVPGWARE